jgi:tetratricopeptide (TPR) repeat protein
MIKIFAIILIFICSGATGIAQVPACPITLAQLRSIQKSTAEDLSKLLITEGWETDSSIDDPMYEYFGGFLNYDLKKMVKRRGQTWHGSFLAYQKAGIPNLIIYQATESCFRKLQPDNSQMIQSGNFRATFVGKQDGQMMEFREYMGDTTSRRFSILIYDAESLKSLLLAEMTMMKNYQSCLAAGNQFFEEKRYKEAYFQYETAKANVQPWDIDALDEIESFQTKCKIRIQGEAFEQFNHEGDSLFEKENFREALSMYENAFNANSADHSVAEKISKVRDFLNLDEFRGKEQSYAYINPAGYKAFEDNCYTFLNNLMNSASAIGNLGFTAVIKFDLQGNNQSTQKINYISKKELSDHIPSNLFANIPPPRIQSSFISTRDEVNFNLTWKTKRIVAVVRNQKTEIENEDYSTSIFNNRIRQYINGQSYKNGVYRFEVVQKKLNSINYQDLRLSSFASNTGPENCFYSFVMPGWGTRRVSDGKNGSHTTAFFIISTAISIGSKIYSGQLYRKYQNDPAHDEKFYRKAEVSNKLFLVTGGISAAIYLTDIIHVFERGIRNDIKCRPLKESLKKGSVVLINSPFKP